MNGKKRIIMAVLLLMVISLAGVGSYYWYQNSYYITTEDAKVSADIVRVSPQIAGKLVELNIKEGQEVIKDEILGRQEMGSIPDSSIELTVLRAPINGVVAKAQGTVGEVVAPGQVIAMLFDPAELYITANIEETKIERLQEGQTVDIVLDQYKETKFTGTVETIGLAANSTFSMLPSSTGGNFTKVVQKIPVKIAIKNTDVKIAPGTNAVVKIHVK